MDLSLTSADAVVHNSRVLFANQCLMTSNNIVHWFNSEEVHGILFICLCVFMCICMFFYGHNYVWNKMDGWMDRTNTSSTDILPPFSGQLSLPSLRSWSINEWMDGLNCPTFMQFSWVLPDTVGKCDFLVLTVASECWCRPTLVDFLEVLIPEMCWVKCRTILSDTRCPFARIAVLATSSHDDVPIFLST